MSNAAKKERASVTLDPATLAHLGAVSRRKRVPRSRLTEHALRRFLADVDAGRVDLEQLEAASA